MKTLFYDIETGLLSADIFSLGEQVIRHNQLHPMTQVTPILTIAYAFDNEPVKVITPTPIKSDIDGVKKSILEFDKILKQADIVIGKNNGRFDNKHINTQRWLYDLDGMPDWMHKSEDLEKQFRKYFNLPSQSLDAISNILGLGGKDKMEFGDWQSIKRYYDLLNIAELDNKKGTAVKAVAEYFFKSDVDTLITNGRAALAKMVKYNKKDVEDTRKIFNYSAKHFELKFNKSRGPGSCKNCGSENIRKNGTAVDKAGVLWQNHYCLEHRGFAGKSKIDTNKNRLV